MITRRLIRPVLLLILILPSIWWYSARGATDARYEEFVGWAQEGRQAEALDSGGRLFKTLVVQKPDNAALALLSRRLEAAQRIRTLIAGAVKSSQTRLLEGVAGLDDLGLTPSMSKNRDVPAALPPPAQELYWTHVSTFSGELALEGLPPHQAAFLDRYYNLQMQDSIMKIGRQIIVADPNSSENVCYAIVLPLLYLSGQDSTWDKAESLLALFSPHQLDMMWRFTLLQAERPQASTQIARCQAKMAGEQFSLMVRASAAADVCVANHRPDLAEKLLHMAIDDTKNRSKVVELRLKIAESYAQCGDYAVAAQMYKQIADGMSEASSYGRTMAMYFGYLARDAKADQIVTETEPALTDVRCKPYLPQILYLRWWALCKTNQHDEAARIAQRLIEQYPRNPCVAPVLLERATDALARQQYDTCRALLTQLTRDLPGTQSAKRAEDMLTRLRSNGIK